MAFLARVKRKLRSWLESGELTNRERNLLGRVEKLESRLKEARQQIHDIPKAVRHELRGDLQVLKRVNSEVRRLDRSRKINSTFALHIANAGSESRIGSELHRHELQIYSQNGEDGIFLYIFDKIGITNRRFVEIGAGGLENNTNNLFFNYGWSGYWLDLDQDSMDRLASYVERNFPSRRENYRIYVGRVTPENINELVGDYCEGEDPDLLTIDVDSYDGQLLRALSVVQPRVLGCEYNGALGLRNKLVPYRADFSRKDHERYYYGASLPALAKIAEAKGYSLIGCDSQGVNCFFVRDDCLGNAFPALPTEEAFVPNRRYAIKSDLDAQWALVKNFPFEEA